MGADGGHESIEQFIAFAAELSRQHTTFVIQHTILAAAARYAALCMSMDALGGGLTEAKRKAIMDRCTEEFRSYLASELGLPAPK